MTQRVRPASAVDHDGFVRAGRRELAAAMAVIEDADGHATLACPHLCRGWLCVLQASGAEVTDLDGLCAALAATPPAGLGNDERVWLRAALPSLVQRAREQREQIELGQELPLEVLRRHARLLHAALGVA